MANFSASACMIAGTARSPTERAAAFTWLGSPVAPIRRSRIGERVSAGVAGASIILARFPFESVHGSRCLPVGGASVHCALLDRINRRTVMRGDGLSAKFDGHLRQRAVHVRKQGLLHDDIEPVLLVAHHLEADPACVHERLAAAGGHRIWLRSEAHTS